MFRPAAAILGRDHRDRSSFCSTRAVTANDLFVLCCFFRKPPSIDYNIPTLGGTFGDLDSLVIQVESSCISSTTKNFADARADVGSRDSLLIGVLGAKNSCKKEQNTYFLRFDRSKVLKFSMFLICLGRQRTPGVTEYRTRHLELLCPFCHTGAMKKTSRTFHYTGCLLGILTMDYHNPHII